MIFNNAVTLFVVIFLLSLVRADYFVDDTDTTVFEYLSTGAAVAWAPFDSDDIVSVNLGDGNGTLAVSTGDALGIDASSFQVPSTSWYNGTL